MKELKIMEKDNFVYRLEDESGQVYTLNLEFFDIEEKQSQKTRLLFLNPR